MAGRQVDDQPPDLARTHCSELGGDHFEVPVGQEPCLWVELGETALGEITEIRAQQELLSRRCQTNLSESLPAPEPRTAINTWISWVPEALVLDQHDIGGDQVARPRTERLSAGFSSRWRSRPSR